MIHTTTAAIISTVGSAIVIAFTLTHIFNSILPDKSNQNQQIFLAYPRNLTVLLAFGLFCFAFTWGILGNIIGWDDLTANPQLCEFYALITFFFALFYSNCWFIVLYNVYRMTVQQKIHYSQNIGIISKIFLFLELLSGVFVLFASLLEAFRFPDTSRGELRCGLQSSFKLYTLWPYFICTLTIGAYFCIKISFWFKNLQNSIQSNRRSTASSTDVNFLAHMVALYLTFAVPVVLGTFIFLFLKTPIIEVISALIISASGIFISAVLTFHKAGRTILHHRFFPPPVQTLSPSSRQPSSDDDEHKGMLDNENEYPEYRDYHEYHPQPGQIVSYQTEI